MARLRVPPREPTVMPWPDDKHPTVVRLCVRCKVQRQPGQRWRQTCPTCQAGHLNSDRTVTTEGKVSGHG